MNAYCWPLIPGAKSKLPCVLLLYYLAKIQTKFDPFHLYFGICHYTVSLQMQGTHYALGHDGDNFLTLVEILAIKRSLDDTLYAIHHSTGSAQPLFLNCSCTKG